MENSFEWQTICQCIKNSPKDIQTKTEKEIAYSPMVNIEDAMLKTVVANTSGICIDKRIRVLGHESIKSHGIGYYNSKFHQKEFLLVAHDVFGGLFAIKIGECDSGAKDVWYFAPDTLRWENLEINYQLFLNWIIMGNTAQFYSAMRWDDENDYISKIADNEMILFYPFLWSQECCINLASKKIVPCEELIELNFEWQRKIYG